VQQLALELVIERSHRLFGTFGLSMVDKTHTGMDLSFLLLHLRKQMP
jgi:hypothetical protein